MSRSKFYCFTANNYTPDQEKHIQSIDCRWMVYGHEHVNEGTPHLQGCIYMHSLKSLKQMSDLFMYEDRGVHLEVCKGSFKQNYEYCTKEDEHYFEKGERPLDPKEKGENEKNKWKRARQLAEQGKFDEIDDELYSRYCKNFKFIYSEKTKCADNLELDDLKNNCLWLYGPSGIGKSYQSRKIANELDPEHRPYLKGLNKWWTGYDHQKVVIIDEADPKHCEFIAHYLKQWADKWSFTAETKGGSLGEIRPEYIIVTSNFSINECFPDPADNGPLHRRFTEINYYDRNNQSIDWPSVK